KRCSRQEIESKQLQLQRQYEYQQRSEQFYTDLMNKQPANWQIDPLSLLIKPDKNSLEYKVSQRVCKELKITLAELMYQLGYLTSIDQFLLDLFLKQYFPNGIQLADIAINESVTDLPLNTQVKVFSIDDLTTTEIDDAFSVQKLNNGWIIGIHIAAPALNREVLTIASERISTVYYPGSKITMLPENIIAHYSLDKNRQLPVVSIYFTLDNEYSIINTESKLEQVIIADNLRTEDLENWFHPEQMNSYLNYDYAQELNILYTLALKLEEKRGRASVNQLSVDYNFSFTNDGKIMIKPRLRGNPIDKLVSELMILANCSWGRMLTNAFIPAIYRVKQPSQPVVMTTTPNSHTGLNVDYYTWATSPLRRAADLINQSQIISLLSQTKPLNTTDIAVASIIQNFDLTYQAYLKFQDSMERYWSLRYLEQEQISQVKARFTFRNQAQLDGVPLIVDLSSYTKARPAGSEVNLVIDNVDFINQTFSFKIVDE
ncbi:MAG: hypothetical protein RLZZ293_1435, partial [Pseudomonadota bacterium]